MLLYILRHAEAEAVITSDRDRKLTPRGDKQAACIGQFCLEHELIPGVVLTSPVVRARETARNVVTVLKNVELFEVPWMACGMSPEVALHEIKTYLTFESVMIVGHEPDLSHLIAVLLGLDHAQALAVSKASLTALELKKLAPGAGVLKFFIPCRLAEKK